MKLILIRHGMTEANEKHLYCGSTDLPLSEAGRAALARRSLPALADLRIVTSGLLRCEQTLEALYGDVPHKTDAAFREMDFGAFEMRSYEQMKDEPAYLEWISGENEANVCPGGESGNQMKARVLAGIERLRADGRDTILVTHGGVIAAIMANLFPNENRNLYQWQPVPGGGYIADLEKKTYSVL